MAFTAFAVTSIGRNASGAVTYSAVDAVNGNTFVNDGKTTLHIKNGGAGALTVTVVSVPDSQGRTGDLSVVIAAGAEASVGCLNPELFNQRSGDVGQVHVSFSVGTSVTMAALSVA